MLTFNQNVLIIGYGAVSQCTLPLLFKHIAIPYQNVTIIDIEDKRGALAPWLARGVKFFQRKVTRESLAPILSEYLSRGGLLIDLAWNIDCGEIITWCHNHGVLYVNTSVEQWDPTEGMFTKSPFEKSLYYRQMKLRELSQHWTHSSDSPTAVLDHGANPGLISHFTKQALVDIAHALISDKKQTTETSKDKVVEIDDQKLLSLIKEHRFGELAMMLGVKVIHCSERDTQITSRPKEVDEFVGTWSIEGLREEGTAPAEMGWGTHEKELPPLAQNAPYGPQNQIFLAQMGINTWVRSWIPHQEIVGMVIRHGEAFGISDRFTVWNNGKPLYRPTVHYAYMPCHETISSLHELRCRNYQMQPKQRILTDNEITSGADILGALVMGHAYHSWWTGSILDIAESRHLAPGQNATTIQVALGVISAVMWMIEHPRRGICLPDDLPHDFVLAIAKPYLGEFVSIPSDWTPLKNRQIFFKENPQCQVDQTDPWQFKNFVFVH